ncbi:hypothetical protein DFJ58DRAFT_840769 [Suillus subalutaceus]|uniref:uncharacterized protein n=1 Tax=Suillus subalutaceus TaxID=48586 RepID=UPI001B86A29B|nr:uncharacterized protein DFJ58DRAFT_840769 [Suillus subalutaceus]KAG1856619.1 hypothetical protein DFJ58DRAFT_840769 [Suillus subalutaceus]
MNASSIAAEFQQLEQYVVYDTIVRRLGVSAAMLYIWDFVLTFHDEVLDLFSNKATTYIFDQVNILWGTKWTTSRILFFINRYFGLATIIASTFCQFSLMSIQIRSLLCHAFTNFDIVGLLLVSNIEIILLRRLFALYDYSMKFMFRELLQTLRADLTAQKDTMGIAIAMSIYAQENEYVLFGVCETPIPSWFIPFWTPIMAFDFVIMVLAGFKSVQHYRHVPNKNWSGARFMKTLARDSFIYFACNFFNYLAITFVFHLAPPEFFQLGASWTIVIPPIAANHLLINMEQSRFKDTNSATNSSTSEDSESSKEIELTQRCVRNIAPLAVA